MPDQDITQEQLKERLHYDPKTGLFTWRITSGRAVHGNVAGRTNQMGYHEIAIGRKLYKAHRLAFLFMTGEIPDYAVDHINRVKNDNRWLNLRVAHGNQYDNNQNRGIRSDSTTGLQGVSPVGGRPRKNKWRSRISVNGKQMHIGCFPTKEEAHAAYITKKKELHPFYA